MSIRVIVKNALPLVPTTGSDFSVASYPLLPESDSRSPNFWDPPSLEEQLDSESPRPMLSRAKLEVLLAFDAFADNTAWTSSESEPRDPSFRCLRRFFLEPDGGGGGGTALDRGGKPGEALACPAGAASSIFDSFALLLEDLFFFLAFAPGGGGGGGGTKQLSSATD